MEVKKYEVDFDNCCASEYYVTPKGYKHINRFMLFVDSVGVKIFTRNGVVYLTPENSEVV